MRPCENASAEEFAAEIGPAAAIATALAAAYSAAAVRDANAAMRVGVHGMRPRLRASSAAKANIAAIHAGKRTTDRKWLGPPSYRKRVRVPRRIWPAESGYRVLTLMTAWRRTTS